ncbi:Shikimate 5-dehydrogenase I alpha [Liberibacter crescens BT-1]|uniref:shikimate dehydrogenase (NADP(+)) n=2 Tax=Liberibacter crescens TaxID=1273132 RepID=L0EYA8_LIBCB|nr:Shikimate 5-dehydrogenase I alpha [Liberibacter crescens BT-1]
MKISGSYVIESIEPEKFKGFIKNIKAREIDYVGGNVTIPYKEIIYKLVDYVTPEAEEIGAINTLWFEDEKLNATNTDYYGFSASLDEVQPNWKKLSKAVVMGSGGASRAVVKVLCDNGFSEIHVVNRTISRANALVDHFSCKRIYAHPLEALNEVMQRAGLFVNTIPTSIGYNDSFKIDFSPLIPGAIVADIVYIPLKTEILKQAEQQGFITVDGLGMLLHQARLGFKKWFKTWPKIDDSLRSLLICDIKS